MQPGISTTTGPTVGLTGNEVTAWQNFLALNKISSYALGIGTSTLTYLKPIATAGRSATIVSDVDQLSALHAATANAPTSGNLLLNGAPTPGSFGPDDGGYVQSIQITGSTFVFDYAANTVTRTTGIRGFNYNTVTHLLTTTDQNGGTLGINMLNGDYQYVVPSNVQLGAQSTVGFTLVDFAGATARSTLSLTNDGVRDDLIITNQSGTVVIQKAALLANDIDPRGGTIVAAAATSDGTSAIAFD